MKKKHFQTRWIRIFHSFSLLFILNLFSRIKFHIPKWCMQNVPFAFAIISFSLMNDDENHCKKKKKVEEIRKIKLRVVRSKEKDLKRLARIPFERVRENRFWDLKMMMIQVSCFETNFCWVLNRFHKPNITSLSADSRVLTKGEGTQEEYEENSLNHLNKTFQNPDNKCFLTMTWTKISHNSFVIWVLNYQGLHYKTQKACMEYLILKSEGSK